MWPRALRVGCVRALRVVWDQECFLRCASCVRCGPFQVLWAVVPKLLEWLAPLHDVGMPLQGMHVSMPFFILWGICALQWRRARTDAAGTALARALPSLGSRRRGRRPFRTGTGRRQSCSSACATLVGQAPIALRVSTDDSAPHKPRPVTPATPNHLSVWVSVLKLLALWAVWVEPSISCSPLGQRCVPEVTIPFLASSKPELSP